MRPTRRHALIGLAFFVTSVARPSVGAAATMSARDLQVLGRVIGFLQPPPFGTVRVGVVHTASATSQADAAAIAALFAGGLRAGNLELVAEPVALDSLARDPMRSGYGVLIAAADAAGEPLMAICRAAHLLSVTADTDAVEAGHCVMAIRVEPRVEIVVNHAAAAAAGISFAVAFRMMIREI